MPQQVIVIEPRQDFTPNAEIREAVAKMVACGLDELDIAFFLKIEPLEARRIFRDELRHGTSYFIGKVGAAMIDSALRGDVNAQRAFLQMRGRWAAPTRAEADDNTAQTDVEAKRKLMSSIIDMVAGKVETPKEKVRR